MTCFNELNNCLLVSWHFKFTLRNTCKTKMFNILENGTVDYVIRNHDGLVETCDMLTCNQLLLSWQFNSKKYLKQHLSF